MTFSLLYFIFSILLSELCFRLSAYGSLSISFFLIVFSVATACLFAAISLLFRRRARMIAMFILSFVLFAFFSINLVYQHIFKSFLSISQIGMGADAISTYKQETFFGIMECLPYLIALLLPIAVLIVISYRNKKGTLNFELPLFLKNIAKTIKKKVGDLLALTKKNLPEKITLKKINFKKPRLTRFTRPLLCLGLAAILHIIGLVFLPAFGKDSYSPYDIYTDTFILSMSEKNFGALTSTRLEIQGLFFGSGTGTIVEENPTINEDADSNKQEEKPIEYNKLEYDFASLTENETDERIKTLHQYFSKKAASEKNNYTGMFEDYNVITLLCESFSPYLIDAQRTPMLYKMANEGFVFNNYYSTICDNTNNSEYVLFNSLLPDTSLLGKGWDTFYTYNSCTAAKGHSFPQTIGNQFKALGKRSIAYHYYWGNYYGRNETHPGFGYDFYSMSNFFKRSEDWPTSDLQMMQQALPKLLKKNENGDIDPFNAYFLTFSGHMYYRFDSNNIARKNKAVSDNLDMSEATRAYVSCNEELEYAVEYLVDELDKAGVLDKTLILVLPDHYPYTLGLKNLSELAGKDLLLNDFESEFNQYKGCFLMWNNQMTEKVIVNDPCCELDILPTLSNLLGLNFDSRLMMGTDIFSNSEHIAILGDRSFVTKDLFYNAQTGAVNFRTSKIIDDAEIKNTLNVIKNKFTISTEILYTDYYTYLK